MKLNKASLFSLFALLELASDPERQLSTSDIADKYGISTHHLSKIMGNLLHEGLVKSVRGSSGGYRFVGSVNRITLLDVIQLFEKTESELNMPNYGSHAGYHIVAELQNISNEIDNLTKGVLDSITLDIALKSASQRRGFGTLNAA